MQVIVHPFVRTHFNSDTRKLSPSKNFFPDSSIQYHLVCSFSFCYVSLPLLHLKKKKTKKLDVVVYPYNPSTLGGEEGPVHCQPRI